MLPRSSVLGDFDLAPRPVYFAGRLVLGPLGVLLLLALLPEHGVPGAAPRFVVGFTSSADPSQSGS